MIETISNLLYKAGRRDLRVLRTGDIFCERNYLLGYGQSDWAMKLPNVVLHHFPEQIADDYSHDHGRTCWSWILRGGYTEWRKSGIVVRRAGSIRKIEWDEFHRIYDVLPDTWTLFFTGFFRRSWNASLVYLEQGGELVSREENFAKDKSGLAGIHRDTPELRQRIAERKKLMERARRKWAARADRQLVAEVAQEGPSGNTLG